MSAKRNHVKLTHMFTRDQVMALRDEAFRRGEARKSRKPDESEVVREAVDEWIEARTPVSAPTRSACLLCGNLLADHDYPRRGCRVFVVGPPPCPHAFPGYGRDGDRCIWCGIVCSEA
jgi:hypothetical protein